MSLEIKIVLNSCKDCRHQDHSGAFTPGGARLICRHPYAPECVGKFKGIKGDDKYVWTNRKLPNDLHIPRWCPLKNGYKY